MKDSRCWVVVDREYTKLCMGFALLLWLLADCRPVLFPNIVIYFHD